MPKSYWKLEWMKIKGHPQKNNDDEVYLKTCYNAIVETFREDRFVVSEVDVEWYNSQVVQLSRKDFLEKRDFEAQHDEPHNFSCTEVLSIVKESVENMENWDKGCNSVKDKQFQFQKIFFSLAFIWFVKSVEWTLVEELLRKLQSIQGLYCHKTPEKHLLKTIELFMTVELEHDRISEIDTKDALELTSNDVHPTLFYLFAVILYKKKQYSLTLNVCLKYISSRKHFYHFSSSIESLLHNLVACSYVSLGKPLTGVVHWRKAVAGLNEDVYMIPLLFNLHQTYTKCKMSEAAKEIVTFLAQNLTCKSETESEILPSIIFNMSESTCTASMLTSQENQHKDGRLLYYIANDCLRLSMANEAVYWYRRVMSQATEKFSISKVVLMRKFILPIEVPPQMQIKAEQTLAALSIGDFDHVLAMDVSELEYCSNCFKQAQSDCPLEKATDQKDLLPRIKSYNASALQFYYCVCVILYRVSALFFVDAAVVVKEIDNCLRAMDTVFPAAKLSRNKNDFSPEDENDLHREQLLSCVVSQKLAFTKAKLHFNRALAASKVLPKMEKDVLHSLQCALQYDSKNLEMRWNVVLLLWNIGQREESIKTWCKTRSLNYKLSFNEVKNLRDDKAALFDACESVTKKELLTKDVSILDELLSILR